MLGRMSGAGDIMICEVRGECFICDVSSVFCVQLGKNVVAGFIPEDPSQIQMYSATVHDVSPKFPLLKAVS